MELDIYLWVENVTVFIRELICFFKTLLPDNKIIYEEKYDSLDKVLDRDIDLVGIGMTINFYDYLDNSDVSEEYGTDVNLNLWFNIVGSMSDEPPIYIAEMINWIMRKSDTDLAMENGGGLLLLMRKKGTIFFAKESEYESREDDYFPIYKLDFDREKAVEFTHDDKWVFCSEEHIQEMERWRKEQEKLETSD